MMQKAKDDSADDVIPRIDKSYDINCHFHTSTEL